MDTALAMLCDIADGGHVFQRGPMAMIGSIKQPGELARAPA